MSQDFMRMYSAAFAPSDPPSPCRICEKLLAERCRKEFTPARRSNKRLQHRASRPGAAPSSSASAPVDQNPPMMMQHMFDNMRSYMLGGSANLDVIPGLRVFHDSGRARGVPDAQDALTLPGTRDALAHQVQGLRR